MLDAAHQSRLVDIDDEHCTAVHRDGERLRSAHAAASRGEGEGSGEARGCGIRGSSNRRSRRTPCWSRSRRSRRLETRPLRGERPGDRAERLVRALQDALRADVDPRSRGHLPVHREPELLEPPELGPRRPVAHEVRVGDEHARRPLVRAEHADGLARLHEQGLVGLEVAQRAHDGVERRPVAGGLARAAVDDELLGALGHLGVEVVHEHAQRRLGLPALGGELRAAGGAHGACSGDGGVRCVGHASIPSHAASVDNGCRSARVRDPGRPPVG